MRVNVEASIPHVEGGSIHGIASKSGRGTVGEGMGEKALEKDKVGNELMDTSMDDRVSLQVVGSGAGEGNLESLRNGAVLNRGERES